MDIQQYEVGLPALCELERLLAVVHALDIVTEVLQEVGQRIAYRGAVIGHKHAAGAIPGSARGRGSDTGPGIVFPIVPSARGVCIRRAANPSFGRSDRNPDDEFASRAQSRAARIDAASLHLHQLARYREADADTVFQSVASGKIVEYPRQKIRGDSASAIAHADRNAVRGRLDLDQDVATVWGVTHRVVEDGVEHLREPRWITVSGHLRLHLLNAQGLPAAHGFRARTFDGLRDQGAHVDFCGFDQKITSACALRLDDDLELVHDRRDLTLDHLEHGPNVWVGAAAQTQ